MHLYLADWLIIVGYLVFSLVVGLYYSKRASSSVSEFFVAGGSLPWWLVGTSMVATTFASDTPLVVSGLIRKGGIYENWLWWNAVVGGMLTVFFYSHLWQRAGLLTDNEFNELRYEGKSASILRGIGALYNGILVNCIILSWVFLAMVKICAALFDLSSLNQMGTQLTGIEMEWGKLILISALVLMTLGYTALSGYWGVVVTDFIQFIFAMSGAIALAVIAVGKLGGLSAMVEKVGTAPGVSPKVFHIVPDLKTAGNLALITFAVQITVQGWLNGQGNGYIAQRLFSAKSERDAVLASLWFNLAQYCLRSWPWILVGLASLVFFPLTPGEDSEMAYPKMIVSLLPVGLRGLMVASLLAAFMSTVSTQLNWGASYLVSDLYRRFLARDRSEGHYINTARLATILITVLSAVAAWQSRNIAHVWIYLITIMSGNAVVGLLRWFWWRINAWAEIAALISGPVLANGDLFCRGLVAIGFLPASVMGPIQQFYQSDNYPIRLVFILLVSTLTWVAVTYLTAPVSDAHLCRFYRRVRPGGWWSHVTRLCPDVKPDRAGQGWWGVLAGTICIVAGIFGVGYLCLAQPVKGIVWLGVTLLAGYFTMRVASRGDHRSRADEGSQTVSQ